MKAKNFDKVQPNEFVNRIYANQVIHILTLRLHLVKKNTSDKLYNEALQAINQLSIDKLKKLRYYTEKDLAEKIIKYSRS